MMIPLVDTHAHLCDPVFQPDLQAVLERALRADVKAIIAVGENLVDARRNLSMAETFPAIRPAAGLYPTHLRRADAAEMAAFIRQNQEHLVAIGEVGLDFWVVKDDADRERQRDIFTTFVNLSVELDLPLNVHSRSAGRHAIELLLANGARRVQLHAFDGKFAAARPAVEAGYFFSIPPSVVRSRQKQKLVKHLPPDCILLESDSPVLGPEPGKRNEPANLSAALETIAAIKEIPEAELAAVILNNTRKLYSSLL
jgi:TatD DNase family protein